MDRNDTAFTGSIPEIYDRLLVPLIFRPYARDMADRVAAMAPQRVLEIAAGSGAATREVAPRLPPDATFVVTDLNAPMLDRARSLQPADGRITWQVADALDLPFGDGTFDAVFCQFAVMFYPDRVRGHENARRMLTDGGTYIFNSWDRIEENEFPDQVMRTLARFCPDDPPDFMARTPHGYHDPAQIRDDLVAAGFDDVDIETVTMESVADDASGPAIAFCQGTPMRGELEARGIDLDAATREVEAGLRTRFGDGPIAGRIRAHVVTARV